MEALAGGMYGSNSRLSTSSQTIWPIVTVFPNSICLLELFYFCQYCFTLVLIILSPSLLFFLACQPFYEFVFPVTF